MRSSHIFSPANHCLHAEDLSRNAESMPRPYEVQRRRFSGSVAVAAVRRRRRQLADPGSRYLRAPDIETGRIAWEIPQVAPDRSELLGRAIGGERPGLYGGTPGPAARPWRSRPAPIFCLLLSTLSEPRFVPGCAAGLARWRRACPQGPGGPARGSLPA